MSAKIGLNNFTLSETTSSVSSLFSSAKNYIKENTEHITWEQILIGIMTVIIIYSLYVMSNQSRLIKAQDDFIYKFILNNPNTKKSKEQISESS